MDRMESARLLITVQDDYQAMFQCLPLDLQDEWSSCQVNRMGPFALLDRKGYQTTNSEIETISKGRQLPTLYPKIYHGEGWWELPLVRSSQALHPEESGWRCFC